MSSFRDRVLALAGVFQAARLAQQLAREGRTDGDAFRASTHSVLQLDAASTEAIFGGIAGVQLGLRLLRDKLTGAAEPMDLEMAKYVISLLQLEAALRRRPEVAAAIRDGIASATAQMAFFESDGDDRREEVHPRLAEKLAELYVQTVSTLTPRILVNGDHGYLATPLIAAKVRTALFAGVRAAVLWHQLGGSRWQLLFSRRHLSTEAQQILATSQLPEPN